MGAAFQLTKTKLATVTVLEQAESVGGIAGSFEISGIKVDYGSHRLHAACEQDILRDIKALLGRDLLDRPRHGRIRLHGRWIHFPLKPIDMMLRLSPSFAIGVIVDILGKALRGKTAAIGNETFASVLKSGLGRTICHDFYFPYARKLWGLSPDEMSATQAKRRVSSNSIDKMLRKILSALPGIKKNSNTGRFFYPKSGFGQISQHLFQAASDQGAEFYLGSRATSIKMNDSRVTSVSYDKGGQACSSEADYVWSTIPMSTLIQDLLQAPQPILEASNQLEYRSMILVYLVLEQKQFSEYDAHYFPEIEIPITRLSEPKNYNCAKEPKNLTVLCAELPCFTSDLEWSMNDKELGQLVCDCMDKAGIPVKVPVNKVVTRRLSHAYPIYRKGYEVYFDKVDQWLGKVDNLLTFGRQGLFAHDNTHHALRMAYSAVDCLNNDGVFDKKVWGKNRKEFEQHVVED